MTLENDNINKNQPLQEPDEPTDGEQTRISIRRPKVPETGKKESLGASGMKLKKPTDLGSSKKLRAPGEIKLKKPSDLKTPQNQDTNGSGLRLKKPDHQEKSDVPSVANQDSSLTKPEKNEIENLSTSTSGNVEEDDAASVHLHTPGETATSSKLTTPGSLQLKKPSDAPTSNTTESADLDSGIRLRKPSASEPSPTQEAPQEPPQKHEMADAPQTLSQPAPENKLELKRSDESISRPSEINRGPDLTPPGIEPLAEVDASVESGIEAGGTVDSSTQIGTPEDYEGSPAEEITFARKRTSSLSEKQKKQLLFIGLPVLLVFLFLGAMFAKLLLFNIDPSEKNNGDSKGIEKTFLSTKCHKAAKEK